ncbi:MAG: hypothetical protein U0900_05095 [Myxococcota bacterium]
MTISMRTRSRRLAGGDLGRAAGTSPGHTPPREPGRPPSRGLPRWMIGLAIAWVAVASACVNPRIHVAASNPGALRDATAIEVRLAPTRPATGPMIAPATTAALLERVREGLRAGAHPVVDGSGNGGRADATGAGAGPVTLELVLLEQSVARRTYTADTDANGARTEERTEAIVVLRALGADGRSELWRCTASSLLPKPNVPFAPSEIEVLERLVDGALARIPKRS